MTAKPFPILFIAPPEPAQAVAASGLIKRLFTEIPGARFTVVAGPESAGLFEAVPDAQLIVVKSMTGFFAQFALWRKTRGPRWGLVVDAAGTGIGRYLRRQRRAEPKRAAVDENRVLTAARMLDLADDPPAPYLYTTPELETAADEALFGEGDILAVGPGADWTGRVWPSERFGQAAAKLLLAQGAPMIGGRIVAMGKESHREAMLTAKFPLPRNRIILRPSDQDLLTDYAWLKRARLYIGGDNVWTHLAAAAGVPTLALLGPTNDVVDGPWGAHTRVVRGPRDYAAFLAIDPKLDQRISHMNDLSVDAVLEAAKLLLAKTAPKGKTS